MSDEIELAEAGTTAITQLGSENGHGAVRAKKKRSARVVPDDGRAEKARFQKDIRWVRRYLYYKLSCIAIKLCGLTCLQCHINYSTCLLYTSDAADE